MKLKNILCTQYDNIIDYGQFTLSSVNNNNNRLKPQSHPQLQSQPQSQLQIQPQPQQDTFRAPLPQQTQRYQANTYVPEYNLKASIFQQYIIKF